MFHYCFLLPSDIEIKLVYMIFICIESSDIYGRSLSSPMQECTESYHVTRGSKPCTSSWYYALTFMVIYLDCCME